MALIESSTVQEQAIPAGTTFASSQAPRKPTPRRQGIGAPARGTRVVRTVALVLIAAIFAYPLAWLVLGSLKTPATFFSNLWGLPTTPDFANYSDAWSTGKIGQYLINSTIVSVSTLVIVLLTALPLSYALARVKFRGNGILLGVFAVTLFLPMQLLVIPLYELEANLGIINTYWALILPYSAGALPFAVVFGTTYMRTLPLELDEAARLDGCNTLQIFWRVIAPLARPAIATMVVMTFLSIWNEFVLALTVTQSDEVRTLPVGLLNFSQQFGGTNYPQLFAALTVATLPILTVFLIMQRQFVRGLVDGAIRA